MSSVVSVIVPTFRREHLLARCLDALLTQKLGAPYEVIVVDDGRSASTREIVEALAQRTGNSPAVRYLHPPLETRGPAAARNAGWRAAASELIAFTDDDTIPDRDWLCEGIAAMRSGADAIWGRIVVPISTKPTDYERNVKRLENAGFVTANCFVRREALQRIGGFDERFKRAWREDSDLYFSLLENGAKVEYAPRAVVQHPVRTARWGVSLREQRNMLFDALLFKKHPDLYRKKIGAPARARYLATVIALILIVIGAAIGWPALVFTAALVWIALTAAFVWKRARGTKASLRSMSELVFTSIAIPVLAVFWRFAGAVRFRVLFA
jgi:GT2 family glycosyltransferase